MVDKDVVVGEVVIIVVVFDFSVVVVILVYVEIVVVVEFDIVVGSANTLGLKVKYNTRANATIIQI